MAFDRCLIKNYLLTYLLMPGLLYVQKRRPQLFWRRKGTNSTCIWPRFTYSEQQQQQQVVSCCICNILTT